MDASLGKVSCTFTNATSNPPALQVCPFSADALRTGSEFKADNMKWLNNFQNVLDRMLTRGYTLPPTCQDPVCKLQKA